MIYALLILYLLFCVFVGQFIYAGMSDDSI